MTRRIAKPAWPERDAIVWPRADPAALATFDPRTKVCSMNCGPSTHDPRSATERKLLCDDCYPANPPPASPAQPRSNP